MSKKISKYASLDKFTQNEGTTRINTQDDVKLYVTTTKPLTQTEFTDTDPDLSTKQVGTLIGETFVKMTEGAVDDDSPVPDIRNYDVYDADFNGVNELEINPTISDDEWFDGASDSD